MPCVYDPSDMETGESLRQEVAGLIDSLSEEGRYDDRKISLMFVSLGEFMIYLKEMKKPNETVNLAHHHIDLARVYLDTYLRSQGVYFP